MVAVGDLEGTLDLWGCMWGPEERERFETALVRAMTDEHSPRVRLLAFAASLLIDTPRLHAAAARIGERRLFDADAIEAFVLDTEGLRSALFQAEMLRGDLNAVEALLADAASGAIEEAGDRLLDRVDIRDLVAVARTTLDARLFREIERRVLRRGRYQRARAENLLGFRMRPATAALHLHV